MTISISQYYYSGIDYSMDLTNTAYPERKLVSKITVHLLSVSPPPTNEQITTNIACLLLYHLGPVTGTFIIFANQIKHAPTLSKAIHYVMSHWAAVIKMTKDDTPLV
jgi:hypothetical protein